MGQKKLGRTCFVVVAAVMVSALTAWGQSSPATTLVEPPVPLLPADEALLAPSDPSQVPADSAEAQTILKEDGLQRAEVRVIAGVGGWVKAYQFGDATGAFSAYTYFRMGGRPAGAGRVNPSEVTTAGGERVILSGTSVVRAQAGRTADSLLARIEVGLPKVGGRRGLAPLLPTLLPKGETDAGAARYALGPAGYAAMGGVLPTGDLGWDKSLEIITAPTAGKAGRGTLTLLLYPTPQIAGDRGRAVEKLINDGAGKYGTVKLKRIGTLVAMASGAMSAGQAQTLVSSVRLNQEVSFDQKLPLEFHAEVRKTASLLQNIAVLSGVLILAALLLGLFLGGARAGVRVLMGKPAASEPEFLTINLRDGGKPKDGSTS